MKKEYFEGPLGESYTKAVHSSGLEIYIMEKPQFSSCYAIFGTKYGSIDTEFSVDGKDTVRVPEGIAHFLEHKLFESEDGDAFNKYALTGASANAYTSFDRTCYLFSCSDKFYENLDILLNFVQSPYFTEATVSKEQGIIAQEIKMYDDSPAWRVMFNMLKTMFKKHPVSIDIAGTVESIAEIDAGLLYKCYETFYNPSNMFICIAGNVDTNAVLKEIEKKIILKPALTIKKGNFTDGEKVEKHFVSQKLSVSIPMFCLGFKQSITTAFQSLKTKVCLSLLLEMICGDSSPLYAELIRKGLINDEFGSEYFTGNGYAALIFEGESSDPKRVSEEIKGEINRIKKNGIDKKLFAAVKNAAYGDAVRSFQSTEGIVMQFVNGAVSGYNIFDEIKYIKSVSSEDILRCLNEFDVTNRVLSVIDPVNQIGEENL